MASTRPGRSHARGAHLVGGGGAAGPQRVRRHARGPPAHRRTSTGSTPTSTSSATRKPGHPPAGRAGGADPDPRRAVRREHVARRPVRGAARAVGRGVMSTGVRSAAPRADRGRGRCARTGGGCSRWSPSWCSRASWSTRPGGPSRGCTTTPRRTCRRSTPRAWAAQCVRGVRRLRAAVRLVAVLAGADHPDHPARLPADLLLLPQGLLPGVLAGPAGLRGRRAAHDATPASAGSR